MRNLLFFGLILLTGFSSCAQQGGQTIPVDQYLRLLAETKNEYLLDVRTPGEFAGGHLNNAVNIDYNGSSFEADIDKLDRNRPVFIYCLSGGRSGSALSVLQKKGFKTVYNMQGGILQWKANNYPLNNSDPATASASSWKGMSMEDYKKLTEKSDVPVLVDFKAAWCGPCKMLKPELDALQEEYKGKLKIVAIDVDENKSLADAMKIRSIPLLIYYKGGKVAMNIEGYADRASLKKSFGLK
jgi:thioredoxin 1